MRGQKTGGRKRGVRNKRTAKREAALKAAAKRLKQLEGAAIPEAFAGDAHAYLMMVYKDPLELPAVRIDAAKAALPYEKPRLAPAEPRRADDGRVSLLERLEEYAREAAIEQSGGRVISLISRKKSPDGE